MGHARADHLPIGPALPPGRPTGVDRRTLIRRAAIVGAAAWTAPVILGSVTSPASALSIPCACYKIVLDANCTPTLQNNNDCSPASTGCSSVVPQNTVSANYVASDFCLTLQAYTPGNVALCPSGSDPFRNGQRVVVTIGSGCDYSIVDAQAKVVGRGGCETSTIAPDRKSATFDKGNTTDLWKSFTLIVNTCP